MRLSHTGRIFHSPSMRIAVFSDLHGNPYACQAVLQALQREGPDALVAAGDLCLGGSDPSSCVELLRLSGASAVYGNTERYLLNPDREPADEQHLRKWPPIQAAAFWTLARLSRAQRTWLSALPFELRFSPTSRPEDDLLVVHANPREVETVICPPPPEQVKLWEAIRQPDDDPELVSLLNGINASVIAFGHFHYVFTRTWRSLQLACVAGCSLPGIDHDWRARFTLFTWSGQEWRIENRWVEYDASQEIDALRASDLPSREFFIGYFG
jgi:hypothetical protein